MFKSAEQVFLDYLKENDLSITPQRKAIVETLLETEGHFSADEFHALVKEKMPELGAATTYRTLKLLVDSGLADSFTPSGGGSLYEQKYGRAHHDHLICVRCEKKIEIYDVDIELQQIELATKHGFDLTRHRMILYGVCPDCQKKPIKSE